MVTETKYLIDGRKDIRLTSYILDDSPEIGVKTRGGVLVCPGGGYFNCSDREAEPIAMRFAAMGYHAFVLRYSVYTKNGEAPFPQLGKSLPLQKETAHPAPVLDIGRAVLYIKSRAAEWNLNPDMLAICGFSAGGHNCAMYSVYWNKPLLCDALSAKPADLKVATAILGYPLTDYVYMKEWVDSEASPMDKMFFTDSNRAFLGMEISDVSDELWEEVSPARLVTKDTIPAFIWGTSEDTLVPAAHSALYSAALAKAHVPYEIHTFEKGAHGLSTADWDAAAAQDQILPDAKKWISLVKPWLDRRFAPELPETSNFEDIMPG